MGGRRSSRGSGGGGGQIIILVVALVFMILAPIMAQFIYFAISRKREYLADASSALYTRYPEGLASALEKLAASSGELKRANQATAPMYTVNPFRKHGRSASDLSSTHPPISERIRILRAMAGISYGDYDQAYRNVRGGKGVVPSSAIAAGVAPLAAAPRAPSEDLSEIGRARETSDVMWRLAKYKTVDCDCGARLRVPPGFREPSITCPHCGRVHRV